MADILKITSAAVESLLSGHSSTVSDKSFGKRIRVSGRNVREISIEEVLRRSTQTEDGFDLASFLNKQSTIHSVNDTKIPHDQSQLNRDHRTVSPNKSVMMANLAEDESKHLVAPSTDSSENVSIIDVGKSLTSSESIKDLSIESANSKTECYIGSMPTDDIDLIPVKDNEKSNHKNTSSSTVSSLKSNAVVDSSTPNSKRQSQIQLRDDTDPNTHSEEYLDQPDTPDLSEHPPALPTLNIPRKGLQQGSLDSFKSNEVPIKGNTDVEIRQLGSNKAVSARTVLQGTAATSKKGSVVVQHHKPIATASEPTLVNDQTSQIAAAVAAAVAATTPFFQLKSEIEEKLQKLSSEMRIHSQQSDLKLPTGVAIHDLQPLAPQDHLINDSLDITLIPDSDDKDIGLPTPVQPRVAPKPRSLRKPQDSSKGLETLNCRKPKSARELRSQFIKSADSDSTIHTLSDHQVDSPGNDRQSKEINAINEDVLKLLKEAKEAKREIEEIRHAERMHSLKTSVFRDQTPADIYLDRIQERETKIVKSRIVDEKEYRTPDYITQAKNTLAEIEERKIALEEKHHLLDRTYSCEDKDPGNEEISKRIDEILDNIQKELKNKDPKKTNISVEQPKYKPKPKVKNKLEEKKVMYERIRAANQQNKIAANIGLLKQQERKLKTESFIADKKFHKSPYRRPELPKSYPLVPRYETSIINQPFVQQLHSTPLPTSKSQKSIQTSPIVIEQLNSNQYEKRTRDVSVCNSIEPPQMVDQYSSPLKVITHERAQNYSPQPHESYRHHSLRLEETNDHEDDDFLGVVDLPQTFQIPGIKDIPAPKDNFKRRLNQQNESGTKPLKSYNVDDDKIAVIQWLEDEIINKLLAEETGVPENRDDENYERVGGDVMENVANLGIDLSSAQLRFMVSEIINCQIEEQSSKLATANKYKGKKSPEVSSSTDESKHVSDYGKPDYDETFESSPTSISRSSLSVVPTPSITDDPSVSVASSSGSSHVPQCLSPATTPSLSPELQQLPSSPDALPEGVPVAAREEEDQRIKKSYSASFYNDTIEQVPLEISEDNIVVSDYLPTPDLTELPREHTFSETAGYEKLSLHPLTTPLNTATIVIDPADSLISQHPLGDTADLSVISQHPLDETRVIEPKHDSSGSESAGAIEDSMTSYTCTDTTDFPISAGEVLAVSVPREIADLECAVDRPLSEGEWPISPTSIDLLQLVKDPDIRHLFEERCLATVRFVPTPVDDQPEKYDVVANEATVEPETIPQIPTSSSLPRSFKKSVTEVPSPLPRPQSNDHTLELVTPLPETPADPFNSPSPPPFLGLKLEDYAYSGESVTKSDASNDSF